MTEQRAEQVAREEGSSLRQPHHHGVEGLTTRGGNEFQLTTADFQAEAVLTKQRRFGPTLGHCADTDRACVLHCGDDGIHERERRVAGTECLKTLIVVSPHGEVRLSNHLAGGIFDDVDPANVIEVTLGQ